MDGSVKPTVWRGRGLGLGFRGRFYPRGWGGGLYPVSNWTLVLEKALE